MASLTHGILITLEGIDGSGKSTLSRNLHMHAARHGFDTVLTREPGASALGKKLRTILQEKEVNVGPKAEFLLFAADRAQHFEELIIPALEAKKMIISDRMADSSLVYQGYGRGLSVDIIKSVNTWVMQGIKPHITVYVHVPIHVALQRITKRKEALTSFEKERIDFIERLVLGFDTIYKNREDVIVIDGQLAPEEVAQAAYHKIIERLHMMKVLE